MKIIVLCGPTATGKTAVSIQLAKLLGCEILCADSIQVYRGLDIGSAKPSIEEREGVAHHLMDIVEVADGGFNVARYKELAHAAITDITVRGKIPLVVGGTGLYINALTYPLRFMQVPSDKSVRNALLERERLNPGSLYARLLQVDPLRAQRLHPNDIKRVARALEVYELSGRSFTSYGDDFANVAELQPPYEAVMLGLTMERETLYARIDARVDAMMTNGLLDEVRRYAEFSPELPALQGLGYRQLLAYLRGEMALDEAVAQVKQATRRFAKRQWIWFNRDKRIKWFDAGLSFAAVLEDMLRYIKQEEGQSHDKGQ